MKECLSNLLIVSPEYSAEMEVILKKLVNIQDVFYEHWYYDPKFKGSYYLKHIVPIMCPEISYTDLTIKSGNQAQYEFRRLTTENDLDIIQIKNGLKAYSSMDTLSLFEVFKFLRGEINN